MDDQIVISYKDKEYQADNIDELIALLRLDARIPSYRTIGQLTGKSYEHVGNVLSSRGLSGRMTFEIPDAIFEKFPDVVIASKFNVPLTRVVKLRKKSEQEKKNCSFVKSRRRYLCKYLFGRKYKPGNKFVEYIESQLEEYSDIQQQSITLFYLYGLSQSLSKDINSDSYRIYRKSVKTELKTKLKSVNKKLLVEEGVIKHARRIIKSSGS